MSRLKFTYAQEHCVRLAGKLMQHSAMISAGARVGVAISGGMDSWVLLKVLTIRQRIVPFPFEIMALHVNPGFDATSHAPLVSWLAKNGIASHVETTDHGLRAHLPENLKKSACFYCAMLRRKRLFELCKMYNLSHLAFGHNADDLVSTFLMNLFEGGRVDGMSANESFFNNSLQVIRPLLMVEKKYIAKAVAQWELPLWSNPCPSANTTRRHDVLQDLQSICKDHKSRKTNVFNGLVRWQFEKHKKTLPDTKHLDSNNIYDQK